MNSQTEGQKGSIFEPKKILHNKRPKKPTHFRVFGENEDGVQTQDTRDTKLNSKTQTSQRSRWNTSTDAPSSCGRGGAQP